MRVIFLNVARAKESIYVDKHCSYSTTNRSVSSNKVATCKVKLIDLQSFCKIMR